MAGRGSPAVVLHGDSASRSASVAAGSFSAALVRAAELLVSRPARAGQCRVHDPGRAPARRTARRRNPAAHVHGNRQAALGASHELRGAARRPPADRAGAGAVRPAGRRPRGRGRSGGGRSARGGAAAEHAVRPPARLSAARAPGPPERSPARAAHDAPSHRRRRMVAAGAARRAGGDLRGVRRRPRVAAAAAAHAVRRLRRVAARVARGRRARPPARILARDAAGPLAPGAAGRSPEAGAPLAGGRVGATSICRPISSPVCARSAVSKAPRSSSRS